MKQLAATVKTSPPGEPANANAWQSRFTRGQVQAQVDKVLNSRIFATSRQNQSILQLLAEQYLTDKTKPLTQNAIAKSILKRKDFDHTTDSTVRVAIERFRGRLREYYARDGKLDELIFELPKGKYRLDVHRRRCLESNHPNEDFAFLKYREGRMYWEQRTPDGLQKALSCFDEALALNPDYAAAHAAIAECYLFMVVFGFEPRKFMPAVKRSAERALRIEEGSAEAHAVLGAALSHYYWNWKGATAEFQRSLEIDPNCVTAHCWFAPHLVIIGRTKEAAKHVRRAQAVYPGFIPAVEAHAAKIFYVCGEHEAALELLQRINVYQPDWYQTSFYRGLVRAEMGELDLAITDVKKASTECPFQPPLISALAYLYSKAGRIADAQQCLDQLIAHQQKNYVPAVDLAIAYNAVNNTEAAFTWLEKAVPERSLFLNWLDHWPPLKALDRNTDSHPDSKSRFAAVRRKLKLPE